MTKKARKIAFVVMLLFIFGLGSESVLAMGDVPLTYEESTVQDFSEEKGIDSRFRGNDKARGNGIGRENDKNYVEGEIVVKFKDKKINLKKWGGRLKAASIERDLSLKEKKMIKRLNLKLLSSENKTTQELLEEFANRPEVEFVEPNYLYEATAQTEGWGVGNAGVKSRSANSTNSITGSGVVVAILDTGVDHDHEDLDDNMWDAPGGTCNVNGSIVTCPNYGWDFVNGDNDPNDDNGHGSHVAGIVAAEDNSVGMVGVAPEAQIMAVKVLASNGVGSNIDIVDGIEFAMNNGADVINMSMRTFSWSLAMQTAVDEAYESGVTVIAATGNEHESLQAYPAAFENAIAVGSINQTADSYNERLDNFSNYGPVDVVAPGSSVYSVNDGGGYITMGGTSMAAPHVAGVAALIKEKYSSLTPAKIKQVLETTATDLGETGRDRYYGSGLVNALAATGTLSNQVMLKTNFTDDNVLSAPTYYQAVQPADGTTAATIKVIVSDTSGNLVNNQSVSFSTTGGTLSSATATTDSNGEATTTLTATSYTFEAVVTATAGNYGSSTITIPFVNVLLVSDSAEYVYTNNRHSWYFTRTLDSLNIKYLRYDTGIGSYPSASYLQKFDAVIWYTGESYMDDDAQNIVKTYLDNGGNVFVTGQDIGYVIDLGISATNVILRNYLKATYVSDGTITDNSVTGKDIIDGTSFTIWNRSYTNGLKPDKISDNSSTAVIAEYSTDANNAGVKYDGDFRSVYLPFGFEAIGGVENRQDVMTGIYGFLLPLLTPASANVKAGSDNDADIINNNNATSVSVDVTFSAAPEHGLVYVELSDGTDTVTGYIAANTAGVTTTITEIDVSGLDDGAITVKAKHTDSLSSVTGLTSGTNATKDIELPDYPTAVTFTTVGDDITSGYLSLNATNFTASATITAAQVGSGSAELLLDGASFSPAITDTSIGAADTEVTFDAGVSTNAAVQALMASGAHTISVKITDSLGNSRTSESAENATVTADYTRPSLARVAGVAGTIYLDLTFSEGIYSQASATEDVGVNDLTYTDNGGSKTVSSVTHTGGQAAVRVNLSAALIAGDLTSGASQDSVTLVENAIFDAAGNIGLIATGSAILPITGLSVSGTANNPSSYINDATENGTTITINTEALLESDTITVQFTDAADTFEYTSTAAGGETIVIFDGGDDTASEQHAALIDLTDTDFRTAGSGLLAEGTYDNTTNLFQVKLNSGAWISGTTMVIDTTLPTAPGLNSVTTPTTGSVQTISGTKDANTSILIGDTEIVSSDSETSWTYELSLSVGTNSSSLVSKDTAWNESLATGFTIVRNVVTSSSGGGGGGGGSAPPPSGPYELPNTSSTTEVALTEAFSLSQTGGVIPRPVNLTNETLDIEVEFPKGIEISSLSDGKSFTGTIDLPERVGSSSLSYLPSGSLAWNYAIQIGDLDQQFSEDVTVVIPMDDDLLNNVESDFSRIDIMVWQPYAVVTQGGKAGVWRDLTVSTILPAAVVFPTAAVFPNLVSTTLSNGSWTLYGNGADYIDEDGVLTMAIDYSTMIAFRDNDVEIIEEEEEEEEEEETEETDDEENGSSGTDGVESAYFSDIVGHWAVNFINQLYELEVVQGKQPGIFEPNSPVTRAEFLKMAILSLEEEGFDIETEVDAIFRLKGISYPTFKDIGMGSWYYRYIVYAKEYAIIEGYPDGSFKPDNTINRAEALKILVEMAGLSAGTGTTGFPDVNESAWYSGYVKTAVDLGVVSGYLDGTFGPANNLTRAEAAKIMVKMRNIL